MKLAVRRTSTAIAVFATAGISGLFMGAAPASAVTNACGTGTLIAGGICEQTFTSTSTFTAPAATSKLEALLVGGGGLGAGLAPSSTGGVTTAGYATGGGGGQVKIVDFSSSVGSATPLTVNVGGSGGSSSVIAGTTTQTATGGGNNSDTRGGASGTNTGASIQDSATPANSFGGGAGAGGSTTTINGGAGVVVSTIAAGDALFSGDTNCYAGGGSVAMASAVGLPGCGGNTPTSAVATTYPTVTPNTGGGGAGSMAVGTGDAGSSGIIVFRWLAPTVTLTFAADGHGTAPAPEAVVVGTAPARPADPTAAGFEFKGWYTDPQLTTLADFTSPLTAPTTFYARWDPALAATGGGPNQAELPIGIAALAIGTGLMGIASYRRKRTAN